MRKYSYLVLGTGMGRAIAYCLAGLPDTLKVAVADVDRERARDVGRQANDFFVPVCDAFQFNAEQPDGLYNFDEYHVVISALPARYNPALADRAITMGSHFCDLGGVLAATRQMEALNAKALGRRVSVVPDCGLMPGLGLMMARMLLEESYELSPASETRDIMIYVGGIPQKPAPPLYYQKMFSLEGLKHLVYDKAVVLMDRVVKEAEPLSDYEILKVPELAEFSPDGQGTVEAFLTAGLGVAPWRFQKLGADILVEKTVRWPGFAEFVKAVRESEFEARIGAALGPPVSPENPDLVWMRTTASYLKEDGRPGTLGLSLTAKYDHRLGLSAMEKTTGFSAALTAHRVARGLALCGVNPPETAFHPAVLRELVVRDLALFLGPSESA